METVIRAMIPNDIPGCAAIIVSYPLWQGYGLTEDRARSVLARGLNDGHILLVAQTAEANPAGFAYCLPQGAFAFSPYLRWLVVKSGMTSGGIGAALLDAVEVQARPHRGELFLMAADFNTNAHRFYERQGYIKVGAVPDYVVSGVTELIYWKRLREQDGGS